MESDEAATMLYNSLVSDTDAVTTLWDVSIHTYLTAAAHHVEPVWEDGEPVQYTTTVRRFHQFPETLDELELRDDEHHEATTANEYFTKQAVDDAANYVFIDAEIGVSNAAYGRAVGTPYRIITDQELPALAQTYLQELPDSAVREAIETLDLEDVIRGTIREQSDEQLANWLKDAAEETVEILIAEQILDAELVEQFRPKLYRAYRRNRFTEEEH